MNKSAIEIERCFISAIDAAQEYVDYNEWTIDPDGEIYQYILQLFAHNYDSVSARSANFAEDSFLAEVVPDDPELFDAFVDVISDEMHELLKEAYGLQPGSGLFVYATVEEQPIVAFFKLNYQSRFTCAQSDGKVVWKKDRRLLPAHTQKEYDYFFINVYDRRVWMSDMRCMIGGESVCYMAERILKVDLKRSEKETVQSFQEAVIDTIRECYEDEAPKKLFEYRREVSEDAGSRGEINPVRIPQRVFADNPKAQERYEERSREMELKDTPLPVSPKTTRSLKKKQRIVTENGIEILVPVDLLEDKNIFDFHQENGMVSITIHDVNGSLK
ncbi:MAG: nucleoid-associated protein [Lachnospiraceae bacterium]|nr:nucleoid-associated protein [Lachnospiraceae bacterium]